MVDIIHLCSTKSLAGATADSLRQILAAAGTFDRDASPMPAGRRSWTKLPESTKRTIAERYVAGETSVTLAAEFGVAKSTVLKLLRDRNVVVRRQPMTPEQVADAQRLYEMGQSLSQISTQMAIPQDTIRLALKAAGVQLRPATGRNP